MALGFGGLSPKLTDAIISSLWASDSAGRHGDRRARSWSAQFLLHFAVSSISGPGHLYLPQLFTWSFSPSRL